ncbi:MAG: hypothetical protein ABJD11_07315 [Gemmatimonadota bacterium]
MTPSDRTPWIIAGTTLILLLAFIIYRVTSQQPEVATPAMANNGAAPFADGAPPAGGGGPSGTAPDISQMTPRERFDRLYDRIMRAAENNDTATVMRFSPMGLGAYQQLDSIDADARYHAAMLHVAIGDMPGASALADTILANNPGHLFAYIVRGEVAARRNDTAKLRQSRADFIKHYDAEMKADRKEYEEHKPVLASFLAEAKKS